jgi:hypothetical protein
MNVPKRIEDVTSYFTRTPQRRQYVIFGRGGVVQGLTLRVNVRGSQRTATIAESFDLCFLIRTYDFAPWHVYGSMWPKTLAETFLLDEVCDEFC